MSNLGCLVKCLAASGKFATFSLFSKMPSKLYSKMPRPASNMNIVDVNIDKMMHEDEEFASNYNYEPEPISITSRDLYGHVIAPIDVNPWIEEIQEDSVNVEFVEKYDPEVHYPPSHSDHNKFEGMRTWLPKKMLIPATYRIPLPQNEGQTPPYVIPMCKFETSKPTA